MSRVHSAGSVHLSVRLADQGLEEDLEWATVPLNLLRNAQPWRTFRGYKGQKHQRVKDLGIKIHPGGTHPHHFDDDWLRDQYAVHLRSIQDIGRAAGTCDGPVLRRLTELGIAIRPVGAHSRRGMLAKLDDSVPRDIRAAVGGTLHGWLRLHRFQIRMAFPTLSATADYLNVERGALSMQFSQLERAIGAELFHRATGHEPQRPSPRGTALLRQLDETDIRKLMQNALGRNIVPINTLYKQLRRLETAGWLRSRRETTDERPHRGGRGRTCYTLTPIARLIPVHLLPPEIWLGDPEGDA